MQHLQLKSGLIFKFDGEITYNSKGYFCQNGNLHLGIKMYKGYNEKLLFTKVKNFTFHMDDLIAHWIE